jgi:hypothetical protein
MFRQVVGTILRLAKSIRHWLDPGQGRPGLRLRRIIEPPPLEVNTLRLLSEFHAVADLTDTWARMLAPATSRRS